MMFLPVVHSGSHGSSLLFSSAGQVAVVPYQRAMELKQGTVEAWIKLDPTPTYYAYVLSRNYGNLGYGIALHGRPDKVFSQAPTVKVSIGVWTHVAIVFSDKANKTYINGELAAAGERWLSDQTFVHDLLIGNSDFRGEPGGEPTGFRGQIDEIRIWSKPHTQAEIRATMDHYLRGNERHLLAYFPFDEGSGQIVHDYTGNLISGCLGRGYKAEDIDPAWAKGVELKGRLPGMRRTR